MKPTFGPWLRTQLDSMGITQSELAQRISVQPSQISRIISGERGTTIEILEAIARALGLSPETVFSQAAGTSNKNRDELSPTKRQLIHMVENANDRDVEMAIAMLEAAERNK